MIKRQKQKTIILSLAIIVIGMVVGYAAMQQLLNINGTSKVVGEFNVQFTRIEENTMNNATTIKTDGVGTTTATFTVDLTKPGSSATYDITVQNKGTFDVFLSSIDGLDEVNNLSPLDIQYSLIGINIDDQLKSGNSKSFQVRVDWSMAATSIPPTTTKTLNLKLNYEQVTS